MKKNVKNLYRKLFKRESNLPNLNYSEKFLKPYLHIGCGDINLEGWINLDARNRDHVHIQTDKLDLVQFANDSLGVIYLSHVLEHVSFAEAESILKNFHNKLRDGGMLLISVPDFESLVKIYHQSEGNLSLIRKALLGGQDYEYNFHKSVYDFKFLQELCINSGFKLAQKYETVKEFGAEIGDFSTYEINGIPVSVNIQAFK
jgi:predicted SAM-dependent methyltransferase